MPIPKVADPLAERLSHLPGALFAVLDGAAFDDVQGMLTKASLDFRPLYLDEVDTAEALATGPHLVPCPNNYAVERLREIAGDTGIVWWAWPDGPEATSQIYRHLRGIGMVEIPTDRPDAPPVHHQADEDPPPEYEAVLLRHADPHILGMILPELTLDARSRLFGKALALVLDISGQEPLYAPRIDEFPSPPGGLLRIDQPTYLKIDQATTSAYRTRLMKALRETCPDDLRKVSDKALYATLLDIEQTANRIGLKTEAGVFYLAVLTTLLKNNSDDLDPLTETIRQAPDPDQKISEMINHVATTGRAA